MVERAERMRLETQAAVRFLRKAFRTMPKEFHVPAEALFTQGAKQVGNRRAKSLETPRSRELYKRRIAMCKVEDLELGHRYLFLEQHVDVDHVFEGVYEEKSSDGKYSKLRFEDGTPRLEGNPRPGSHRGTP